MVAVAVAVAGWRWDRQAFGFAMVVYGAVLVWAVLLAYVDLQVQRLPDALVLPAYPVTGLLLVGWSWWSGSWSDLGRAAVCGAAAGAVFLLAAVVPRAGTGMGLGDVKLAGVLGMLLGWLSWQAAIVGVFAGFVAAAVAAVVLLTTRRATWSSHVPFGPAMLLGAYLASLLPR